MGQDRVRGVSHETAEIQDVEVDLARAVSKTRDAAFFALHLLKRPKQSLGAGRPEDLRDGIAEVGLVRVTDRVAPIKGGNGDQRGDPRDVPQSALEPGRRIFEVRAEPDIDGRAVSTLLLRRRAGCR